MTYSIVACDDDFLGVATASHWPAVGALVTWCEAGVGAVATQAFTEPAYGPRILTRLRQGREAKQALLDAIADDDDAALRQVTVIDARGATASHTGRGCLPETAAEEGAYAAAAGNMLTSAEVPDAMLEAFAAARGDLATRLVGALAAGEDAGGDARGRQAAALQVVHREGAYERGTGTVVDLRVDDHPQPVLRLRELLHMQAAYGTVAEAAFPPHGGALGGSAGGADVTDAVARLQAVVGQTDGEARSEASLWLALCHLREGRPHEARGVLRLQPSLFALARTWARHLGDTNTQGEDPY